MVNSASFLLYKHSTVFHLPPDAYQTITEYLEPYKSEPLVKAWFGPFLSVVCFNPEDIKIVLNSPDCLKKPRLIYSSLFDFGLISINGEEYKAHRKAVSPLFTPKSLKTFLPSLNKVAYEFLVNFDGKLKGSLIDVSHDTLDFALNTSFRNFMNIHDVDQDVRTDFLKHFDG
jgi:cytochrome P450